MLARGDVAEAVKHEQDVLGAGFKSEFGIEAVEFHGSVSVREKQGAEA